MVFGDILYSNHNSPVVEGVLVVKAAGTCFKRERNILLLGYLTMDFGLVMREQGCLPWGSGS